LPVILALLGFILYYFVTSKLRKPVRTYTTTTMQKPKVVRTISKKIIQNLGNGCLLVDIDGVIYYDYKGKALNLARKEEEINMNSQAILIGSVIDFNSLNKISLPLELIVLTVKGWHFSHFNYCVAKQIFLKKVTFNSNNLENFPSSWLKLTNIEDFECTNNQLIELPYDLTKWTKLTYLNLDGNKFLTFPPVIFQLKKLTFLDLSLNFIKEIPTNLPILSNLETLNLSFNLLQKIPLELTQMKSLKVLKLDHNQLADLPLEITALTNLKTLDLTGNPLNIQKFRWLMPEVEILG
jgi:Leucine-rich repeat (LRR) protein